MLKVTDFFMKVSGSSSGDGDFKKADFNTWLFDTGSAEGLGLDLTKSFLGQTVTMGAWGPNDTSVNPTSANAVGGFGFNPFSNSSPAQTGAFVMTTNGGIGGDSMLLTALGPAAVPEPSTYILLTIALGAVGFARKKMSTEA